jgi:hypothetical protein
MNLELAQEIVKQWYSKASEPSLTYLLNRYAVSDSVGKFYRPFIVAAVMMKSEQKTLVKADVATWELNKDAFLNLLGLQRADDLASGLTIPEWLQIDVLLPDSEDTSLALGIYLI